MTVDEHQTSFQLPNAAPAPTSGKKLEHISPKKQITTLACYIRADNGSVGHGSLVKMGQQIWVGHVGHGSVPVTR